MTHFEDAGPAAIERFGSETALTESFRRIYSLDYLSLYLVKVAASILVSMAAALFIQVLVNLRLEVQAEALRLAPEFSRAAALSVGVVFGLVTAWEVTRRPFQWNRAIAALSAYIAVCAFIEIAFPSSLSGLLTATLLVVIGCACARLKTRLARLVLTFGAFAATLVATHLMIRVILGPTRAFIASAVLVAVWFSTVLILTRMDRVFHRFLENPVDIRG